MKCPHFPLLFEWCRYNKLSRTIRELAKRVSEIDASDPFRTEVSAMLLEKLYVLGLIPTKWDLNNAVNISASSFCRRRLPVVMVRSKCYLWFSCEMFKEEQFCLAFRPYSPFIICYRLLQIICPSTLRMRLI